MSEQVDVNYYMERQHVEDSWMVYGCICMFIHIYVCLYTYMYVYTYICMFIHLYVCLYIYMYIY